MVGDEETSVTSDNCTTVRVDDEQKALTEGKWCDDDNYARLRIDFQNLKYSVRSTRRDKQRRRILRDVQGYFRRGCLNAIIGPSGAGKTTLLTIVCGLKSTHITGRVCINGSPVEPNVLRKIACFIPQEFTLLPWLTTRETLYFAARLKIPWMNPDKIRNTVTQTAGKLGLTKCLKTTAEKLSGGEKKRLSIGVEIVVTPLVLILDEPTSGLDSVASSQVIKSLKKMSEDGCTIVCSIHQPSSQMMTMFDNVLLLAEGRTMYCGPPTTIVQTFAQAGFICPSFYNIGEFVIEVATGQRTGDRDLLNNLNNEIQSSYLQHYNGSCIEKLIIKRNNFGRVSSRWNDELCILLWRAATCIRRDWTMTKLRFAAHIVVALLLGVVFRNFGEDASKAFSNISCLFFFLLFLFFANAMPAVQMFPVEAATFAREYMNNWYRLWTYYMAKVITDLPLQILCPTFFLLIAYSLTGQPLEADRFAKAWLICFLISLLAQSFGILTGAIFNAHIGCFLVPALNIPMFLFAGFFLKLDEVPTYLHSLRAISYFRYAFEGLLQAVYDGDREPLQCSAEYCLFRSPKYILSYMNMPSVSFTTIALSLTGWIVFLHASIYIVLRWKLCNTVK